MNVSDDVIALHSQICDVENFLGRIDGSIDRAVPVNTNTGCALHIRFWYRILSKKRESMQFFKNFKVII